MKTLIITISFFFIATGIKAQQDSLSKFRIGFAAGIEKSMSSKNIAFGQYTGYSVEYNKPNYLLGLSIEYIVKTDYSINIAINYVNRDFSGTYYCTVCDFIAAPSPEIINFRFIEVPLTLKYYFLPNKTRLFGEVGIINLFVINKEVTDNSYGIGIKLGAGIEYSLTQNITFSGVIDYNNGITKLFNESDFKVKTLAIRIGITKRL